MKKKLLEQSKLLKLKESSVKKVDNLVQEIQVCFFSLRLVLLMGSGAFGMLHANVHYYHTEWMVVFLLMLGSG